MLEEAAAALEFPEDLIGNVGLYRHARLELQEVQHLLACVAEEVVDFDLFEHSRGAWALQIELEVGQTRVGQGHQVELEPGLKVTSILQRGIKAASEHIQRLRVKGRSRISLPEYRIQLLHAGIRSEERRVGKECRSRWSPYH